MAALHPAVKSISAVSDAQRTALNRDVAKLLQRLMTESCKTEAQQAVKYEGSDSFRSSYQILGQVAARVLFSDPSVSNSIGDFVKLLDKKQIEEALKHPQTTE